MKIVVCIKQVPSTNEVHMNPVTNTIIRDGKQSVTNPFDTYALEQAVQIKEQLGGEVIALSMGIPATERLLRDATSRGADRSLLLSDRSFAGADTLATSYTLSLGIKELGGADLILCGKMAVDGDTAQIGPELAEQLGLPHVTDVLGIDAIDEREVLCRKATDNGWMALKVKLPALLTVVKDLNMPRMSSLPGILYSLDSPFEMKSAADLAADPARIGLNGSPTQVVRTYVPQRIREAIVLEGDAGQLADDFTQPFGRLDGRGQPQHVRDQPADGLADRGGLRAGLGGVDEDFEGLVAAVLIDRDEGFPQGRADMVGVAPQVARPGVRSRQGCRDRCRHSRGGFNACGLALGRGFRLQHDFLARAGNVDRDAFAAQLPGQLVSRGNILFAGVLGEVDRLAQAVVHEGLQSGLHAHVLLGADIR